MEKKTCIISDLHLAIDKAFDNFGLKKIALFRKFAEALLKSGVEVLVLAGDIIELWQGKGGDAKKIRIVQERYKEFFEIIEHLRYNGVVVVFLYGNHDLYCKKFFKWKRTYYEEVITTVGPVGIHVEHGDKFDKTPVWLSKLASNVFTWIEKLCGPKVQDWFDELIANGSPASKKYKGSHDEYMKGANIILKKVRDTCVQAICVFGHTHIEKLYNLTHGVYINSGTLINSFFHYVLISYPVLDIRAKNYKGGATL